MDVDRKNPGSPQIGNVREKGASLIGKSMVTILPPTSISVGVTVGLSFGFLVLAPVCRRNCQ
jgi:hypothetical protein